jgi:hypothetical protein
MAGECLIPGSAGHGSSSGERTIGINVTALDFSMGTFLPILWSWESMIRSERGLTPPALIKALATKQDEILATCQFHLAHLEWILVQDWVQDFAFEINQLKAQGMIAARQTVEQTSKINCPGERSDGLPCGRSLHLSAEDFSTLIFCSGCKTEWTAIRLIAVKMADRTQKWWIDLEAASNYLALSERQLRRIVKSHKIPKKGQLYDLHALLDARSA